MEKLFFESTRVTPFLIFDPSIALLDIRGRSSPDNSVNFYSKVLNQLDIYINEGENNVEVNIFFEYLNSSTSKIVFDIFRKLTQIKSNGKQVVVNWHFEEEDDDMMEAGEDYADLIDLPFNLVAA